MPYDFWLYQYSRGAKSAWNHPVETADWKRGAKVRHQILSRMIKLRRGDLVVTPRTFADDEFTICQVTDGYRWDESHFGKVEFPGGKREDCAHYVAVDPTRLVTVRYSEPLAAKLVVPHFQHYRSAVTFVREPKLQEVIRELYVDGLE